MSLSKEDVKLITGIIAKQAKQSKKEAHHDEQDHRLRNTQLLLREYPKLQAHVDADPEAFIQEPDLYEALTGVKVEDRELAKYNIKTVQLMRYVNAILASYKQVCQGGDESEHRRWDMVYQRYLAPKRMTQQQLADHWKINQSGVSRELTKAMQDLSVMLFGVVGLQDFIDCWIA